MKDKNILLKEEIEQLEAERTDLIDSRKDLKERLDILTNEVNIETANKNAIRKTIEEETTRLFEIKAQYGELFDNHKKLQTEHNKLQSDYELLHTEFTKTFADYEARTIKLEAKLTQDSDYFTGKIDALKNEITNLERSRESSQNTNTDLNDKIAKAKAVLGTLQEQSTGFSSILDSKNTQLHNAERNLSLLDESIKAQQKVIADNNNIIKEQETKLTAVLVQKNTIIEESKSLIKDKVALVERVKLLDEREEKIKAIYEEAGVAYP